MTDGKSFAKVFPEFLCFGSIWCQTVQLPCVTVWRWRGASQFWHTFGKLCLCFPLKWYLYKSIQMVVVVKGNKEPVQSLGFQCFQQRIFCHLTVWQLGRRCSIHNTYLVMWTRFLQLPGAGDSTKKMPYRSLVAFWKYWCKNWVTLDARQLRSRAGVVLVVVWCGNKAEMLPLLLPSSHGTHNLNFWKLETYCLELLNILLEYLFSSRLSWFLLSTIYVHAYFYHNFEILPRELNTFI